MPNFLRSKDSSSSLGSAVSSKTLASTTNSSTRPPPSYTSHSTVFSLAPSSTVVPSSRSSNTSLKSYSSSSTVRVKSPPPSNSTTSKPAFSSSSFSPYLSHSNAHSTAQFAASTASFNLSPPVLPTYHPTSLNEKWHYTFKKGDQVWVNRNFSWRLGTVCEDGSEEIVEGRRMMTYTVTWQRGGFTMRGAFAPAEGNMKPNTEWIRRLLIDERAKIMVVDEIPRNIEAGTRSIVD